MEDLPRTESANGLGGSRTWKARTVLRSSMLAYFALPLMADRWFIPGSPRVAAQTPKINLHREPCSRTTENALFDGTSQRYMCLCVCAFLATRKAKEQVLLIVHADAFLGSFYFNLYGVFFLMV